MIHVTALIFIIKIGLTLFYDSPSFSIKYFDWVYYYHNKITIFFVLRFPETHFVMNILLSEQNAQYSYLILINLEASRHLQRWCPLYSIIEEWKSSFLVLLVMPFLFLEGRVNNLRIFPEKSCFVNDPISESTFPYYIFIIF